MPEVNLSGFYPALPEEAPTILWGLLFYGAWVPQFYGGQNRDKYKR